MYKYFFSIMLPVLAVMAVNQAIAVTDPPPPPPDTGSICKQNYNSTASARNTCKDEAFYTVDSTDARITASCETTTPNQFTSNDFSFPADKCGDLQNCGGILRMGNC